MADYDSQYGRPQDDDAQDELLQRVRATLAPLPAADPMAVARVLSAVHGRRARAGWRGRVASVFETFRAYSWSLAGVSGVAAVALVAGFVTRGAFTGSVNDTTRPAAVRTDSGAAVATMQAPAGASATGNPAAGAALTPTATPAGEDAPIPVQFVLDARAVPGAATVALAGDFNEWNPEATPLERLPGTELWTVTLPVTPGRHVYAFVVDGTRWIADPRAPRATDTDFGRPGSVLFVGTP